MASQVPCKKNGAAGYIFYVGLVSQANGNLLQVNPTLAAGDVKIAIDDGDPANLATLPVVDANFTKRVKVVLSQAETNGDNLSIIFCDAAGAEWCDQIINIQTTSNQIDDIGAVTTALTASAATKLAISAGTIVSAAAAAGTLSTTQMTTTLTELTSSHYVGRVVIWTSGVLQNQASPITAYDGGSKMLTFTAVTEAPTAGDTFIIV